MMYQIKTIAIFLCLLSCLSIQGQNLSKSQAIAELRKLKEGIETYHAALERYNPDFETNFESLIQEITTDSISVIQHFRYVSQLCAISNEGHFALGDWDDSAHAGFLNNTYKYAPFSIRILGENLFVWNDFSNERSMGKGDEILSINGKSASEILSIFYKTFPSDGRITTYIDRVLEGGFSWMFYLYVDQPNHFEIDLREFSGNTKKVDIQALIRSDQVKNVEAYSPQPANENTQKESSFHQLVDDGVIARLTLPSFDFRRIEKYGIKPKQFYHSIFSDLRDRNIQYLIIDLRGNTGGRNEMADEIVPYINKGSNTAPYLSQSTSWKGKTKKVKVPKPSKLAFQGEIYVLVDGRTYSTAAVLSRYLREFGNAIMIGEETGTRYEGFVAGSSQYVTLPVTQWSIGIPRYLKSFPSSQKQNTSQRGLLPDHQVVYTIEDKIVEKDLEMDLAQQLIHSTRSGKD